MFLKQDLFMEPVFKRFKKEKGNLKVNPTANEA